MFTKMRSLKQAHFAFVLCICLIFQITNCLSADKISDKRLCADRECLTMISKAKALATHKHADPAFLSFTRGDYIKIYSKSAGSRQDLWGGELNGKKGYFPRSFVREMKADVPNPQYEVETEHHIPLKDRVLGRTPPQKKVEEPVQQKEEAQQETQKPLETKSEPTETEEVKQEQAGTDAKIDAEPEKDETDIGDDETELNDDDDTELDEAEADDMKNAEDMAKQQDNIKAKPKETEDVAAEKPSQDAGDKTEVDETELAEDQDTDNDTDIDETEVDDDGEEGTEMDDDGTDIEENEDIAVAAEKKEEVNVVADQDKPMETDQDKADKVETKTDEVSDDSGKKEEDATDETEVEENEKGEEGDGLFSRMFSGEGEGNVSEENLNLEKANMDGDQVNDNEQVEDNDLIDKNAEIDNEIPVLDKEIGDNDKVTENNKDQIESNNDNSDNVAELSHDEDIHIKDENLEINNDMYELDKEFYENYRNNKDKNEYDIKTEYKFDDGDKNQGEKHEEKAVKDNLLDKIIHEHIDDKETDHQDQIDKDNRMIEDNVSDDNTDRDNEESNSSIDKDNEIYKQDSNYRQNDIEGDKEKEFGQNIAENKLVKDNSLDIDIEIDESVTNNKIEENDSRINDKTENDNVENENDINENPGEKLNERLQKPSDTDGSDTQTHPIDSKDTTDTQHDINKEDDDDGYEDDLDDDEDIFDDEEEEEEEKDDSHIIDDSKTDEDDLSAIADPTEAVTNTFTGDKKEEDQAKDNQTPDEKTEEQAKPEEHKPAEKVEETETIDKATDTTHEKPDIPAGTEERKDEVVKEDTQEKTNDDVLKFVDEGDDTGNEPSEPEDTGTQEMKIETANVEKQEPETPDAPDDASRVASTGEEITDQDRTIVSESESTVQSVEQPTEAVDSTENMDVTLDIAPTSVSDSNTDQITTQYNTDVYQTDTNIYNTDAINIDNVDTQYIDTASDNLADTNSQIQASFTTTIPASQDITSVAESVHESVAENTDVPIDEGFVIDGTTFPPEYFGEPIATTSTSVYDTTPLEASFTDTGIYNTDLSQATTSEALQATETQTTEEVLAAVTDETLHKTTVVESVENIETSVTEVSIFSTESTNEDVASASPDVDPTAVVKTDLPVGLGQGTETPSYTSMFDSESLEASTSSLVHVLGTSFSYASSVTETGNTVPIDNVNSASMNANISETGEVVKEPSVEDNMYQAANFLSRKPLSTETSTQYPEASRDHQPEMPGDQQQQHQQTDNNQVNNNLNVDSSNKDLNYNKDMNILPTEEAKTGDVNNNYQQTTQAWRNPDIPDQNQNVNNNGNNVDKQKEGILNIDKDFQSVTPPTTDDKQSPDDYIAISRKVPDPFLDEEVPKPQESLLQSLEPMLKYIVQILPPSVLTVLEQEPLGLSPTMAVLVTIVSMNVVFFFTVISCLCKGGKKSGKQDPIVIIQGLEEKLFITTKEKENMEDELQMSRKKCKEMEQEMNSQQSNTGSVEMDLKTVKLHNEALKKQVMSLQQEVTDYKHEVTEKTKDIKQKASVIAEYERELDSLTGRSQESEQVVHKTSQALSEKEDELRLLQSQVESLSEQVTQQETRKQQLEEEATEWNEKVQELTERVEQFTQDSRRMQDDLAFKENELEVLRDCFLQVKAFQGEEEMKEEEEERSPADLEEKLKAMMDVSRINASLRAIEEEKDVLQNKLKIEVESRKEMEDQIQQLKRKMETNQSDKMKAERQSQESQTRLEVLSKYFKEKEAELARQLGEQEVLKNQNLSKLESSDSITQELQKENDVYRQQIDELKMEITKADRDFRSQIAANEKKAHDNWLATRAAERELKESRHECGMLRQKLTDLERKLMQGPPGLIRPITHRGMPPPGMLNGPPPPPPDRPGSRGSVHIPGHVTPRLRDDDYRSSPGPDRLPPPDRRMPPGPRPPPPPMDARSPPPYGIRPPYPGDRRSPPPFDRYPPPRGPMGPRGPRPPFPGGPLPPPPHLHSPPPRSPEHDDSRQGPGYRGPQGSRDRGPPPPRHQSQV